MRRPTRNPTTPAAAAAASTGREPLGHRQGDHLEQVDGVAGVGLRCGRDSCARNRSATPPAGCRAAEQFGLEALGELRDQVARHVGEHAAAELCRLARDREVGGDRHDVLVASPSSLSWAVTIGRGGAVAARLLALGLEHDPLGGLVLLLERRNALVGHRDRADLDLHGAGEVVTVDRQQGGAGQARRDAFDVGEHLPDLGGGHRDPEFVVQFHALVVLSWRCAPSR